MGDIQVVLLNITYGDQKAPCSLVFHQVKASPIELVSNIWLDMVHTLKGQWDCIIGDFDDKAAQRHPFYTLWKATPHLCPQRMPLLFGTFSHQDGYSLRQSLRNQNFANCLH